MTTVAHDGAETPPTDDLVLRIQVHVVALGAVIACWAYAGEAVAGDAFLSNVLWGSAAAAVVIHGLIRVWRPSPGWNEMWRRAPGVTMTMFMAPAAVALLASASVPGGVTIVRLFSVLALVLLAGVWVLRVATFGWSAARGRQRGSWLPLLAAPVGGAIAIGLIVADVPLRARWAASRDAFAEVAEEHDRLVAAESAAAARPVSFGTGDDGGTSRVGAFQIESGHVSDDRIVLYEATSGFLFSGGGFAYLPDGTAGVRIGETTRFEHLEGDWYGFVYSV